MRLRVVGCRGDGVEGGEVRCQVGELAAENVKVSVPDGVGVLVFVAGVEEVQEGGEVVEFGEGGGGDVELFLGEGGVRGWGVVVHLDDWFFWYLLFSFGICCAWS